MVNIQCRSVHRASGYYARTDVIWQFCLALNIARNAHTVFAAFRVLYVIPPAKQFIQRLCFAYPLVGYAHESGIKFVACCVHNYHNSSPFLLYVNATRKLSQLGRALTTICRTSASAFSLHSHHPLLICVCPRELLTIFAIACIILYICY